MIGIFGGTFDPIHYGHLRTALEVTEALDLSEMRFVPCRIPPHRMQPKATEEDRLTMLRLSLEGSDPRFGIDDREMRREGPSYMVDTLASIRAEVPDRPLCLIVGLDAFQGIPAWHRWREIFRLAHVIVMQRPFEAEFAEALERVLEERLVQHRSLLRSGMAGAIRFEEVSQLAISASRIRELVRSGKNTQYLLPDCVRDFISSRGLYRSQA